MPRRLLITASRTFTYVDVIEETLAAIWWEWGRPRDAVIVVGGAIGGDKISERLWRRRGLPYELHRPNWHEHADDCPAWHAGREICHRAGHRRDEHMVDLGADVCQAFIAACVRPSTGSCKGQPDPHGSHGATETARKAKAAGIDTRVRYLDPLIRDSIADLL